MRLFRKNGPFRTIHPSYISSVAETNIILKEAAEVWVTFVHEGAGYRNALGYYTYSRNSPPQSTSDINNMTILFPNTSYVNSGGGLISGDKVLLGTFPADTVIGYFLIANGWDQNTQTNNTGYNIFYSNSDLNPESSSEARRHNVLLWDSIREKLLLGFEDINRENSGCDNDFNDAIFYLTVSPSTAIEIQNLEPIDTPVDSDGDGLSDTFDTYPNDPLRAFDNYYPSENSYGTLAFEDLWPNKGDYDFNDMVVDYNFKYITNTASEVIDIYPTFIIKAVGAGFHNGFALELPIDYSMVASVSGYQLHKNLITLNSNGTEAGQANAVIVAWDDVYKLIDKPEGYMVNTESNAPYVDPVTVSMEIHLTENTPLSSIGLPPYNPFLIINQNRSMEVHLPGDPPTTLAETEIFGTGADHSDLIETFYITKKNLPWALNIPYEWDHLKERKSILSGYLNFDTWSQSGGVLKTDWYINTPQNRNFSAIWSQPY